MFRSEEMMLCEIYLPSETVYPVLAVLGERNLVEFKDLNKDTPRGRKFLNEVRMCEDLEGKIYYLRLQTKDYNVSLKKDIGNPEAPKPRQIIDLAEPGGADFDLLRKLYQEVKQISYNLTPLERTKKLHTEYQEILRTACNLLYQNVASLSDAELGNVFNVHIIGGVLPMAKWMPFEKTLWRLCHGNYILQTSDLMSDDMAGEERRLFVILVHGSFLLDKINKLCHSFSADMYAIPENRRLCSNLSMKNKSIIADLKKTIATSKEHYKRLLAMVATNLTRWLIEVKKMKYIYHTINQFKGEETGTFLISHCWIPKNSFEEVKTILHDQARNVGTDLQPLMFEIDQSYQKPPTYFRLNKFTRGFQKIIDAYGHANYKELNPMPYTIITFPFLFGIMFGDTGHGIILLIIALMLLHFEKKLQYKKNEIIQIVLQGRYLILLMGLFSIYAGIIYNDYFAYFVTLGTSWNINKGLLAEAAGQAQLAIDPKYFDENPVAYGIDPIWKLADNRIDFFNSFKMKLSIIIGVVHMTFGHCLSIINLKYFKDYLSLSVIVVPQIVFFLSFIGYLVFIIMLKWLTYGVHHSNRSPSCAPLIIMAAITMEEFPPGCDQHFYALEHIVKTTRYVLLIVCIPLMLFIKPAYYIYKNKPAPEMNEMPRKPVEGEAPQQVDKMAVMVYTIIHTIEFLLGTVSYTASYLRLWALSLAHASLAEVLDTMVLSLINVEASKFPNILGALLMVLGFHAWAMLTCGILILMEGLSAFLHALRLHWMEFQTKFYVGQGYPFTPFSFMGVVSEAVRELK